MQRQVINSSSIKSAGYLDGTLEVEFKQGLIYQYYGVPEEYWINLMVSESAGSYLAKNIKSEFPFKMIDPNKNEVDTDEDLE